MRGSHCICRSTAANSREEAALLDGRGGEGRGVRVGPEGLPQGEQRRKNHRFATGNGRNGMFVLLLPMELSYQQQFWPVAL